MADKPDFIVDPSGNVRDVRNLNYVRQTAPSPTYKTVQKSNNIPGGVVVIPIGLIVWILITVIRSASSATTNTNYYADSNVSDLNLGNMYFANGEYDMALVHFNMAINSNPDFVEVYNSRGLAYHAQGDFDRAIADFNKTIELLPDWSVGYGNRGLTYFAKEEYDLAIADFDRAIELEADFAKAYYNRGLVYQATGNYEAAIADFDKAIELTPEGGLPAIYNKFNSLTPGPEKERIEGMLNYYQLSQSEADLPLAYANRGLTYFYKGDSEQAIADLEKALDLGLQPSDQEWVQALSNSLR